ncbi:4Fe-4S binding protein [Caballeronia sp. DA-9]|uniref:4Fe-4S binding protein n=1 Tax=Caballeronia sp. DA-9 TaxID=3436237 RepID=UPI003F682040
MSVEHASTSGAGAGLGSPAACKQAPGVIVPVVNLKRCEGKADCAVVCPEDVFLIRRIDTADYARMGPLNKLKLRVHGMKVAYTPNANACRACGLCVTACPERAITLARAIQEA